MVFLIYFFLVFSSEATDSSLYQGKVQKIQDFGSLDLSLLKGAPSLWYFYQPNCESCQRQSRDFSCLPTELKILAVAVLGSYEANKKEFRKHFNRAEPVYGGKEWEKKFKVQQTPTLLLIDKDGSVLYRHNSFLDCAKILKLLKPSLN
jgi:thioredoxin-related protein